MVRRWITEGGKEGRIDELVRLWPAGLTDVWVGEWADGWLGGWVRRWVDRLVDEPKDRWMDRQKDS